LYITSDDDATVEVVGWFCRVFRKSVNIVSVDEAPIDGLTYGRKDAEWVEVIEPIPLSGTEVDKPITGDLSYGQLDGTARKITFKDANDDSVDLTLGYDGSELGTLIKAIGFYGSDGTTYGKLGLDQYFNPVTETGNGTYYAQSYFDGVLRLFIVSNNPTFKGIELNSDFSDNISDNCLVQKIYVDGLKGKHISKTTTEINAISSPQDGETYFNTTLGTMCFYDGSAWQKVSFTTM